MKPVPKLTLQARYPNVGWKRQGMDSMDVVWKYNPESFRGYRLHDKQVGQWSDVASISVMH